MVKALRAFVAAAAAFVAVVAPQRALATFPDLMKRLPADTNAVFVFNFDAIMKSPLGQQMDWANKWSDAYENGPVPFPVGTSRAVVGAYFVPAIKDSNWKIAMMDMSQQIDLPAIARAEGGYPDRMWDKDAVVSPQGAFFIKVAPDVLAAMEPANRPYALKWIRESAQSGGPTSPFLQGLVIGMGATSQIAMGIDTSGMFSAPAVRRNMAIAPFASLGEKADLDLWSNLMASMQDIKINITVTDKISAKLTVDFGMDIAVMQSKGRALFMEIMDRQGMSLPDVADWTASVDGKSFIAEGTLTPQSMRMLVQVIGMPAPAMTTVVAEESNDPKVVGPASKRYFRTISDSIDQFRSKSGGNYQGATTWVIREAQRIERLPILNVDPELVAWGGEIANRLRQVGGNFAYDQQNNNAKVMNVQAAGTYDYSYNGGNGYWGSGNGFNTSGTYGRGTQQNLEWQRQRAQIYQQSKADSIKTAMNIFGDIGSSRDKMRAQMVEKYKMEF